MWTRIFLLGLILSSWACGSSSTSTKANLTRNQADTLLYGTWFVDSLHTLQRSVSGAAMGNPEYTFTTWGTRIKRYRAPAHADSVHYHWDHEAQTISFPDTTFPTLQIQQLTPSRLRLKNDKVTWSFYR